MEQICQPWRIGRRKKRWWLITISSILSCKLQYLDIFKLFNHHLKPINSLMMNHKIWFFNKHGKSTREFCVLAKEAFLSKHSQQLPFNKTVSKTNQFSSAMHQKIPHFWKDKEEKFVKRIQMMREERKKEERKRQAGKLKSSIRYQNDASFVLVTIFIKKNEEILFTRKKVTLGKEAKRKKCQSGFYFYFCFFSSFSPSSEKQRKKKKIHKRIFI